MTLRILSGEAAQRFALPALGRGRLRRPARKMIQRRKLLEIAADSPASGARFVGHVLFTRTWCLRQVSIYVSIINFIHLSIRNHPFKNIFSRNKSVDYDIAS